MSNQEENVNIVQVNLGRSSVAHNLLDATMGELNWDVAIISEPNVKIANKGGLGSQTKE